MYALHKSLSFEADGVKKLIGPVFSGRMRGNNNFL
jgi:hypothetical protein